MMRQEDSVAVVVLCHAREKFIARFTCSRLQRHFFLLRQRPDVCRAEFEIDIHSARCKADAALTRLRTWQSKCLTYNFTLVLCDQFLDKMRVGVARPAAQLMIQVADGEVFVTKVDKLLQQGDGIPAAGNTDEVALARRKVAQQSRSE